MTPVATSAGPGTPVTIARTTFGSASPLPPSVVCGVSQGANLQYNVEVTGDAVDPVTKQLPVPPPGANWPSNWVPLPGASGLTTSAVLPIPCQVTAVRLNVTAYTSGGVSFAVTQ